MEKHYSVQTPYVFHTDNEKFDVTSVQPDMVPKETWDSSRESFNYLSPWQYRINRDESELVYRLGIKSGIMDNEGAPVTLIILYSVAIVPSGYANKEQLEAKLETERSKALQKLAELGSQIHGHVIATMQAPPDYMLEELEKSIG